MDIADHQENTPGSPQLYKGNYQFLPWSTIFTQDQ